MGIEPNKDIATAITNMLYHTLTPQQITTITVLLLQDANIGRVRLRFHDMIAHHQRLKGEWSDQERPLYVTIIDNTVQNI